MNLLNIKILENKSSCHYFHRYNDFGRNLDESIDKKLRLESLAKILDIQCTRSVQLLSTYQGNIENIIF